MSRFLFAEYHGDDAGMVLARMLSGDDGMPQPPARDNSSRIVGFAPNPEQPELDIPDEDEEEEDDKNSN